MAYEPTSSAYIHTHIHTYTPTSIHTVIGYVSFDIFPLSPAFSRAKCCSMSYTLPTYRPRYSKYVLYVLQNRYRLPFGANRRCETSLVAIVECIRIVYFAPKTQRNAYTVEYSITALLRSLPRTNPLLFLHPSTLFHLCTHTRVHTTYELHQLQQLLYFISATSIFPRMIPRRRG